MSISNNGGSAKEEKAMEKDTQTWQYKGPNQQQEKKGEQRKVLENIEDDSFLCKRRNKR